MTSHVGEWWRDLGSAALVGTARRPVPALPDLGVPGLRLPDDLRSEEALLASAALGAAARRAGHHVPSTDEATGWSGAPADMWPEAGRLAVQLLELVITQPPAGPLHRPPLLAHWLGCAAVAGRRVPHHLLPVLLELATSHRQLRPPTALAIDERGRWLAARREDWAWVTEAFAAATARAAATGLPIGPSSSSSTDPADADPAPTVPTDDEWARLASAERPVLIGLLRPAAPAAARALVESTWQTDSAKDRRAHLDALRVGLGPDDEPLLERALDDRAASVREGAQALLDALPGSRRAARMAARLRPLLHSKGVLKRTIEVTLPDEPDAAGVRDGLGKPPPRRSARGWWLERIAAGAPLSVWTDVAGGDPATVVSRLSDVDALSGIRAAARARGDAQWAAAVLGRVWDPALVPALDAGVREHVVLARVGTDHAGTALLQHVPAPWSAELSGQVLARLRGAKAPAMHVQQALPVLVRSLHPGALPDLERWLDSIKDDRSLSTNLRHLLQFHSVKRSITEAFR